MNDLIKLIISYLRKILWGVPVIPQKPSISIEKENKMGLVYNAYLPEVLDADVVKKTVKVVIDGEVKLIEIDQTVDVIELPPVKDNASVELSVSHTDDAGNTSDFGPVYAFTAVDTIFPVIPGQISVKLIAEVADPVVVPDPEPEPEPEPETPVEPE